MFLFIQSIIGTSTLIMLNQGVILCYAIRIRNIYKLFMKSEAEVD